MRGYMAALSKQAHQCIFNPPFSTCLLEWTTFSQKLASALDTWSMSELTVTEGYRLGAGYGDDPCIYNVGIDIR